MPIFIIIDSSAKNDAIIKSAAKSKWKSSQQLAPRDQRSVYRLYTWLKQHQVAITATIFFKMRFIFGYVQTYEDTLFLYRDLTSSSPTYELMSAPVICALKLLDHYIIHHGLGLPHLPHARWGVHRRRCALRSTDIAVHFRLSLLPHTSREVHHSCVIVARYHRNP